MSSVSVNMQPFFHQSLICVAFRYSFLQQESREDEHGIAYAMLYLSIIYCRVCLILSTALRQITFFRISNGALVV